jgi:hypothetical protein
VPWFSTTAEQDEFAEKPNNGRFISSQSSCLADFDVRHAFWRFEVASCRGQWLLPLVADQIKESKGEPLREQGQAARAGPPQR